MLTGDGADYAQLKVVAEGLRQRAAAGARRRQGQSLRRPGRAHLRRIQPRQAGDARHHAAGALRLAGQAERRSAGRHGRDRRAARAAARHRRARRRQGRGRNAGRGNGRTFRLGDIATVTHGFVDPPGFSSARRGKTALGVGVVTANGANILELGKDVDDGDARVPWSPCRRASISSRSPTSPKVVEHAVGEFVRSFVEALAIVLFVSFLSLGWRTGIVVALSVPLVLAHRLRGHERDGHGPAPHHARRADHRARPAGRRRHHRGRDDGGEDGAGLGPHARGVLRLGLDRLPDAHRHAGHGRRLPAHRLRQFRGRRICRRHLLGRGDRADRLLVRGGDLHALYRRQAAAELAAKAHGAITIRMRSTRPASIAACARDRAVVRRPPHHGGGRDRRRLRRSPSSASAMSSSSSSRCRSGPSCSSSCACRRAPPSTSPRRR